MAGEIMLAYENPAVASCVITPSSAALVVTPASSGAPITTGAVAA